MAKQTTIVKITRPKITVVYERKRLFKRLDQARDRQVIWISGPAGSGKTTLAASWIESRGFPCLWYQMDEGDNDAATFFYYLGLAARQAVPRVRSSLPLLTPEYAFGVPTFTRRFFEALCSRLSPPFIMVFDNEHRLDEASPLHELMQIGLSVLPEGVTAIVISRSDPPPLFAGLRAGNRMEVVEWEELRLSLEETRGIMRLESRDRLSTDAVASIHDKTGGWAAGLLLMTKEAVGDGYSPRDFRPGASGSVFDYFAGELFGKAEPPVRDFLLKTSLFPSMTPRMAERLTEVRGAARILADLHRRNNFTERRVTPELTYQYHTLFREFLRKRFEQEYPQTIRKRLVLAAAQLLETSGRVEDAVDLFRAAEAWQEAAGLILRSAPAIVSQGRWQTLKTWLESFPRGVAERLPWFSYWQGVCDLPFFPVQSGLYFKKAFQAFGARKDAKGLFLSLAGMFDAVGVNFDGFAEYDRLIHLLYDLRGKYREYPSPEIETRIVGSMLFALYVRQPRHPDLEYWMSRGDALVLAGSDKEAKARILFMQALIRLYAGELEKTALLLDSLRETAGGRAVTPLSMALVRDLEVNYTWLASDFDKNREATDNGISLADVSGVHTMDVFILGNGAAGALSTGDGERACGLLKRMKSFLDGKASSWSENLYHNLSAWKYWLERDLVNASLHADRALAAGARSEAVPTEAYHHLIKAIVMHELKKEDEALLHISKVRTICRSVTMRQTEFRALLVEAGFAFDRGSEAAGKKLLSRAMALGREQGYSNAIFWSSSEIARLCAKSLQEGIEVDYVTKLVRKRGLVPENASEAGERWPWPLKIHALGSFRVERNGEPLMFSRRAPRKPLDLLRALVALGGNNVAIEALTEALWPEAEGDAAEKSLSVTLTRLRELLGVKDALVMSEGAISLDERFVWTDVRAFEAMTDDAQGTPGAIDTARLLQALRLYRGPFLENEDQVWVIRPRERLSSRYLQAVEKLGAHWEKSGDLRKAIDVYQKGIHADDLIEKFHIRIMQCLLDLGSKAEALSAYRRLRKTLHAVGVEPSPEAESLHSRILSSGS